MHRPYNLAPGCPPCPSTGREGQQPRGADVQLLRAGAPAALPRCCTTKGFVAMHAPHHDTGRSAMSNFNGSSRPQSSASWIPFTTPSQFPLPHPCSRTRWPWARTPPRCGRRACRSTWCRTRPSRVRGVIAVEAGWLLQSWCGPFWSDLGVTLPVVVAPAPARRQPAVAEHPAARAERVHAGPAAEVGASYAEVGCSFWAVTSC